MMTCPFDPDAPLNYLPLRARGRDLSEDPICDHPTRGGDDCIMRDARTPSQEYWLPWLSEAERRDFELKEGRFLNLMAKYKSQKKGH